MFGKKSESVDNMQENDVMEILNKMLELEKEKQKNEPYKADNMHCRWNWNCYVHRSTMLSTRKDRFFL